MKIAICDDEIRDIEQLKRSIQFHSNEHEIVEFLSPELFLKRFYGGEHFDILFLDVQMPGYDGWEIAKELKQSLLKVFIVMVTVHSEYIYSCFDRVDWFTPKPVSTEMVKQILNNAADRLFPKVFEFQTDEKTILLTAPEILYFEVKRNTLTIYTKRESYKIRLSLRKAKDMLGGFPQFIQVHGSYIINLDHYDKIKEQYIFMKNNAEIKLSRTYRSFFFSALSEYTRGK